MNKSSESKTFLKSQLNFSDYFRYTLDGWLDGGKLLVLVNHTSVDVYRKGKGKAIEDLRWWLLLPRLPDNVRKLINFSLFTLFSSSENRLWNIYITPDPTPSDSHKKFLSESRTDLLDKVIALFNQLPSFYQQKLESLSDQLENSDNRIRSCFIDRNSTPSNEVKILITKADYGDNGEFIAMASGRCVYVPMDLHEKAPGIKSH